MRRFTVCLLALVLTMSLGLAQGSALKCKAQGLHMCCEDCEKTAHDAISKVSGISEVACDRTAKTVTFKARNQKAADDAVAALLDSGFYFQVTIGELTYSVTSKIRTFQGNPVAVRNVHACCEGCEKAIEALFKDAIIGFQGKGPVKDVTFAGKLFDAEEVLQKLHEGGFHGVVVDSSKK